MSIKFSKKQLIEILENTPDDVDIVIEVNHMEQGDILKPISSVSLIDAIEKEETFVDAFDYEEYTTTTLKRCYGQKPNKKVLLIG